jgi:UDP-glucuronate decarboxylase
MKSLTEDLQYITNKVNIKRFNNKKVLLIGSNGFLGQWFADFFDHNTIEYLKYDVTDGRDICTPLDDIGRYDFVVNCAGVASPEKYMKNPMSPLDVSYIGTKNVLEYCLKHDIESVLLFSSSEVYGTPPPSAIPTSEDFTGTIPTMSNRSCYDIGKQVLETLVYTYHSQNQVRAKMVRPFNMYGPYMGLTDGRVLSNWMRNYLKEEKISIYGNGLQTRTFCYAADGISMMLGVLLDGRDGEVYNVGNSSPELNIVELATHFYSALESPPQYEVQEYPNSYPSDEPTRRCPDIQKVIETTQIQPSIPLHIGIRKMYEYYKQ